MQKWLIPPEKLHSLLTLKATEQNTKHGCLRSNLWIYFILDMDCLLKQVEFSLLFDVQIVRKANAF